MTTNKKRLLISIGAVATVLTTAGGMNALAQSGTARRTGIQNNGADCVARDPTMFFLRNVNGFANLDNEVIQVLCPFIVPSDDSAETNEEISNVEVHHSGASSCNLVSRGNTGSVSTSPAFVSGPSATTGHTVLKLTAAWRPAHTGRQAALVLKCTLQPSGTIVGSFAKKFHHRIEGGI
jgi:hypothetical protein